MDSITDSPSIDPQLGTTHLLRLPRKSKSKQFASRLPPLGESSYLSSSPSPPHPSIGQHNSRRNPPIQNPSSPPLTLQYPNTQNPCQPQSSKIQIQLHREAHLCPHRPSLPTTIQKLPKITNSSNLHNLVEICQNSKITRRNSNALITHPAQRAHSSRQRLAGTRSTEKLKRASTLTIKHRHVVDIDKWTFKLKFPWKTKLNRGSQRQSFLAAATRTSSFSLNWTSCR